MNLKEKIIHYGFHTPLAYTLYFCLIILWDIYHLFKKIKLWN